MAGASDSIPAAAGALSAVLRPVCSGSGFEEALERLLQVLRLRLVAPGGRLPPERELAARLGIGRVTLRAVLRVLVDEGLVESRRGRHGGTFVIALPAPLSAPGSGPGQREAANALDDVLRFREVLEVGAAGLCAAERLSGPRARRLRAALAATGEASAEGYRGPDTLLHLTLAELSGSATLAAQYAAVRARVNGLLDSVPLPAAARERSQHQHAVLVEAVLAGDAERARATMREHCAATAALLRGSGA